MTDDRSLAGTLLTWFIMALVAIALLKVAFWALGIAVGVGFFFLFRIAPFLLLGYFFLKTIEWLTGRGGRPPRA